MSKINNTETMPPEVQEINTPPAMKLDVHVRPIAPVNNLLGFASVTVNDSFVVEGFRICFGEKGLYVNMPSTKDGDNWRDTFKPITAEARRQLTGAILDGYGLAIERMQATLDASRGAAERPSVADALKDNADKVKNQPVKSAGKAEQSR